MTQGKNENNNCKSQRASNMFYQYSCGVFTLTFLLLVQSLSLFLIGKVPKMHVFFFAVLQTLLYTELVNIESEWVGFSPEMMEQMSPLLVS